jgi:hypothetical protein
VLLGIETEQLAEAKPGAEEHGDRGVIAEPLVGSPTRSDTKRLGRGEEPDLVGA